MRAFVLRTTEAVASVASFVVENVSGIFPVLKRAGFLTVIFCVLFSVSVLAVASCDKSSAGLTSSAPPQSISGGNLPAHDGDSIGTVNGSPDNDAKRQVDTVSLYDTLQAVDAYSVTIELDSLGFKGSQVDMNALKRALKDSLAASYEGRFTSGVATGDAARVRDLAYDMDSQTLSWTYANDGDYDLDGSVGVPDITPIAENYLATVEYSEETYNDGRLIPADDPATVDGAANWYKAFLDTDRGGDIGISDITAIADNYLNEVSGYAVFVENDPTLPVDDWRKIADIDLDDAKSNLPADIDYPVPFAQTVTETDGHFALVRPYDSTGKLGDASDIVVLSNTVIPQAYAVVPADGITGDVTTFVAVTTGLMPFDWYWNFGAAAFPSTSSKENPTVILGNPGEYDCSVRVTNPYGSAYFVFTITVDEEPVPPPPPVTAFAVPGATPQYGDAPLTTELTCNNSYSTAGDIVLYEWDFETDGVIDVTQEQPSHVMHEYSEGEYTATLYVTDEVDYRASADIYIVALSNDTQWEVVKEITASQGIALNSVSIFVDQSTEFPSLAYVTSDYKHCFSYEEIPDKWISSTFIPASLPGSAMFSPPVMLSNGVIIFPAMYHFSYSEQSHIAYVQRNHDGTWQEPFYVDMNISNAGNQKAAVHPDGYPALIYNVGSSGDFVRYSWWDGDSWTIENTGIQTSLRGTDFEFVNGEPAFTTSNPNLSYFEKKDGNWRTELVATFSDYMAYQNITMYDGAVNILAYSSEFTVYQRTDSLVWQCKRYKDEWFQNWADPSFGRVASDGKYYLSIYAWDDLPFEHLRYSYHKMDDLEDSAWISGIIITGSDFHDACEPCFTTSGFVYVVVFSNDYKTITLLRTKFE